MLIVSGDIFNSANPSNSAFTLYYNFLKEFTQTTCRQAIIIGGNHDSVSALNAASALLKAFNIHVIGGASELLDDEIIEFRDKKDNLKAVTCAVPFLRDRDIRTAVSGERYEEQEERVKEGIYTHYRELSEKVDLYKTQILPIIATGHLFVTGGKTSDSEKEIYLGKLDQVRATQFLNTFDYVALGHLHRPQRVSGVDHIRYSGSAIPLSFSEVRDKKQLLIVDFEGNDVKNIEEIEIPILRKLVRFKGDFETVRTKIKAFRNLESTETVWAEAQVGLETFSPDIDLQIRELAENLHLEILKVIPHYIHTPKGLNEQTEVQNLGEMHPAEVFEKKCQTIQVNEYERQEMIETFRNLLSLMEEERRQ